MKDPRRYTVQEGDPPRRTSFNDIAIKNYSSDQKITNVISALSFRGRGYKTPSHRHPFREQGSKLLII